MLQRRLATTGNVVLDTDVHSNAKPTARSDAGSDDIDMFDAEPVRRAWRRYLLQWWMAAAGDDMHRAGRAAIRRASTGTGVHGRLRRAGSIRSDRRRRVRERRLGSPLSRRRLVVVAGAR